MIKKVLSTILGTENEEERQAKLYSKLIRHEAKIGGTLFGPVPAGGNREFFCLDERTWVWHEEWKDPKSGERKHRTTRYDVRPSGIVKMQNGQNYQHVSVEEAQHLYDAAQQYQQRVGKEVYSFITNPSK
jgi:hypothetical protein